MRTPIGVINSGHYGRMIDPDATQTFDAVVAPSGGDYALLSAAITAGKKAIYMKAGTYSETANIVIPAASKIVGEAHDAVILDFGATAFGLTIDGGGGTRESTGTITATSGSAAIAGSGTAFTNLTAGDFFFIDGAGYGILSIASATALTLATTFQGLTRTAISTWHGETLISNVTLENFEIMNTTGNGLNFRQVENLTLRGIEVNDCGTVSTTPGAVFDKCHVVLMQDVRFQASPGVGCRIDDSHAVLCSDVISSFHAGNGIEVAGASSDLSFLGCQIRQNGGVGFEVQNTANNISFGASVVFGNDGKGVDVNAGTGSIHISSCHVERNGAAGIDVDGTDCTISNNHVLNNVGPGVQCGSDATVTGNIVEANSIGIDLTGDDNCVVSGNRCNGNTAEGILCPNDDNTIVGNQCTGNGAAGIEVTGDDNIISGNRCSGNTDEGININGAGAATNIVNANNCLGNTGTDIANTGTSTIETDNQDAA